MSIELFVPGRLCLFGEHSDWAGMYRTINSELEKGQAIVSGLEQGIYATCEISDQFIVESDLEFYSGEKLECVMDSERLMEVASEGGFFSYVAGVASYINDNYSVGGVRINVTKMDLPLKITTLCYIEQDGKWLMMNPKVLILDEPTRGIDVGAKAEIYQIIMDLASQGVGILLVSSEMEEIMNLSDRIIVMCEGQINGVLNKDEVTQEKIMGFASEVVK